MDALQPSPELLAKLGSIIIHADEYTGPDGHNFDLQAFHNLLSDPEVSQWMRTMDQLAMLPKKRTA